MQVPSFWSTKDLVAFINDSVKSSGLKKTDVLNGALATFKDYMQEAAPYAALLTILAEQKQCSPVQLVVRMAIKQAIEEFPELRDKLSQIVIKK